MSRDLSLCCVCRLPRCCARLVRLYWEGGFQPLRMYVAEIPNSNNVLICEDCIRQIKRLPLSDLAKSAPVEKYADDYDELPF